MSSTTPSQKSLNRPQYIRVYVLLVLVSAVLILILPEPSSTIIFLGVMAGSAAIAASESRMLRRLVAREWTPPRIALRFWQSAALEISLILIALFIFSAPLRDFSPGMRVRGQEFSYLINSGVIAAEIYGRAGAIPLWNPFMGDGEPLLESPFSFVLNPLMTLPIFIWGAVQGTKAAVLLHIGLMGVGGWLLGWALGLKAPARVLLGLLLGGSGSLAGAIGMGFYQMGLSQTYVPWVLAALLLTMRTRARWPVALLAVASTLMVFAGTFWYILPTAIAAALLLPAHTIRRTEGRVQVAWDSVGRVLLALIFVALLGAVRLLPQVIHHGYVDHPRENLDWGRDFFILSGLYFTPYPTDDPDYGTRSIHYHYIVPAYFALFLLMGRVLVAFSRARVPDPRRRVLIPAFVLVVIFTVWAQVNTPILRWLYDTIPFLGEWRFVGRMMAAGSLWLAIIAAVWFDDVLLMLRDVVSRLDEAGVRRWQLHGPALLAAVLIMGGVAAGHVLGNWEREAGVISIYEHDREPLRRLRAQYPQEMLPVLTSSFFAYLPHYEMLTRAAFGNPDYRAGAVESTIGAPPMMWYPPPFAVGYDWLHQRSPADRGYVPLPLPGYNLPPVDLWRHPQSPPYAFRTSYATLTRERQDPLSLAEVEPVLAYTHNIDWVEVRLARYAPDTVVVLREVAYPGWRVYVNDRPVPIESVGGYIGVRLLVGAPTGGDTRIAFVYQPDWLYAGALVSLLGLLGFSVYGLRLDQRFAARRRTGDNSDKISL